ncbi:MAG: ABC transporter substrate-binding protein [Dehalococcoidales bacterium]
MKRLSLLLSILLTLILVLLPACAKPLETVKIGVMLPFTGPLSEFGGNFQKAADLAAKQLEEAGVPVELVYADTQTSAIPAVEAARKLVDVDQVFAIVGAAASGVTIPIAESVTIPKQVPLISYASTSPLISHLPADEGQNFVYRTCPSDALQGVVQGRLAAEQGYKTASVIFVNNPYGQGLADVFKESFEGQGGKVLATVPHDEKAAPTYVAELKKADEGNPDVLVAISYPGHATIYLKEAIEGGFFDTFLFCDGTKSEEIIAAVGAESLEGMLGTAPGSEKGPASDAFESAYNAEYGELPPLPFMTNVYDAVVVTALAGLRAQLAGDLTPITLRNELNLIASPPGDVVIPGAEGIQQAVDLLKDGKDINFEGSAGAIDFDNNGDVVTPIEIWKYTGGTIETVRLESP